MTATIKSFNNYKFKTLLLIFVVMVLLTVWANLAPISSAAIAQGHLRSHGFTKKIQHLKGGIVENIFVKEGQVVQQGETLIQLATQNTRLALSGKLNQLLHTLLQQVHFQAIINKQQNITFSTKIQNLITVLNQNNKLQLSQQQFHKYLEIEQELTQIYRNQLEKVSTAILGKQQELASVHSQLNSLEDEHQSYKKLAGDDYLAKQKLLPMEREISALQANVSRISTNISQYKLEQTQVHLTEKNRTSKEFHYQQQQLMTIEAELPTLLSDINQLKLIIERSTISSPVTGLVNNLTIHSVQGTIAPQAVLMEIVPSNDKYVVEVMLAPDDIESIKLGAKTQIRFTAYNQRKVDMLPAKVKHISPDRLIDPKGNAYYRVELAFDEHKISNLGAITLYSGMGAEAYIETGKQTLFDYLFHSFIKQKNKAFRDS